MSEVRRRKRPRMGGRNVFRDGQISQNMQRQMFGVQRLPLTVLYRKNKSGRSIPEYPDFLCHLPFGAKGSLLAPLEGELSAHETSWRPLEGELRRRRGGGVSAPPLGELRRRRGSES